MKYLLMLTLLLANPLSATEIYLGYGVPYKADDPGSNIRSISIERYKWKVDYSYWQDYTRTPWDTDKYPTWGRIDIDHHNILSASRNIYQYDFDNKCKLFVDFGLAYTTKLSRATSSPLMFQQNFGYQCGWWRAEIKHHSNAGIKGHNAGGNGIFFSILLWGDD